MGERKIKMVSDEYVPLYGSRRGNNIVIRRVFTGTLLVGMILIWLYRAIHIPKEGDEGRWGYLGLFAAELWFGLYFILTIPFRFNPIYRAPFTHLLSLKHEKDMPKVDIFVCTADPTIEPPTMVINTVLSVMAYEYPSEKLAVYLSDDSASQITFYALLEASLFSQHWIPFCKKFQIQTRSPTAYFSFTTEPDNHVHASEFTYIKKLYEKMEDRIRVAGELGRISENALSDHIGFSQWTSSSSPRDHDTILQVVIDGQERTELPSLVYLAREKRTHYPHNFKAGAMNALIRVSEKISNGAIILNVDCDMYSNDSKSVRDALCYFMDEETGHDLGFVQFPQNFHNITKNDLYGASLRVTVEDFHGLDGVGGPLYVGTGCFHRRSSLCGLKFTTTHRNQWKTENDRRAYETTNELQERVKILSSCEYEKNTEWGKQMGLKYGCPVEDVITGLYIQCQGWRSVYYNPVNKGFLGTSVATLGQTLVQHKRWAEGDFQILLSKYSPVLYGHGRISPLLRMGYCAYCFWAPNCFATLYYSLVPSLYLLKSIPLYPQITSPWFLPFAYIVLGTTSSSLIDFILLGGTMLEWWNEQRMWLYKRATLYLFSCIDTACKIIGMSSMNFEITAKVVDDDVLLRYEQEIMEFGNSTPAYFTILSFIAIVNFICLVGSAARFGTMCLQALLCGIIVLINLPIYQGLFLRNDKGKIPTHVVIKSVSLAAFVSYMAFLI